jgi:hypothetical protein
VFVVPDYVVCLHREQPVTVTEPGHHPKRRVNHIDASLTIHRTITSR